MRCATPRGEAFALACISGKKIEESALMSKGYSEMYEWSWDCTP